MSHAAMRCGRLAAVLSSGCFFLLSSRCSQQPAGQSSEWYETGVSLLILAVL
jgi:hypothetical protein